LLAEAKACPALIRRSEDAERVTTGRSSGPFPAMALLSDPALDIGQYLEELVRIAVSSAQQAEDMSVEARRAHRKTQRSMAAVAAFGALGLMVGIAGFAANHNGNVRLAASRDETNTPQNTGQDIASLQQQRKAEEEAGLARQGADQRAIHEALQHRIAELKQQANALQDQVAGRSRDLEAAGTATGRPRQNLETPPPARPLAQEASAADQQRGAPQHQTADPPQQALSLQDQVARHSDDLEATRTWNGKPRRNPEVARTQIDLLQQQRKAELALRLPSAPPPNPASAVAQPIPVLMPGPSSSQQLLIAQQRLGAGRLDEARRLLTMVQTQMVFQPVEPDQRAAQRVNTLAADVGNAIRWLDKGDNRQAMEVLNRAMYYAGAN
jgi:hypothetical protein